MIAATGIETKLKKYNQQILAFEAKFGMNFQEFARKWESDEINAPFSHEIESDFIDWEMLEIEKQELLAMLGNRA